jgi:hypothetical protein
MSGESTGRTGTSAQAFERAFGDRAACNRCRSAIGDYRVIATFLHDTVAMRAYCPECYEIALEGEYHARGDGMVLDYPSYAQRFGAPGPPPPPMTPVDRLLAVLLRDVTLQSLSPPSEALARRQGPGPYRFRVEWLVDGAAASAELRLGRDGRLIDMQGERDLCARLKALLGPG